MDFFHITLNWTVLIVELIGFFFMVYTVLKALYEFFFIDNWDLEKFHKKPILTDGIISALELLMVAEIMKTMIAFEMREIMALGLLVLIRVFLSYVLRKNAKAHGESKDDEGIL